MGVDETPHVHRQHGAARGRALTLGIASGVGARGIALLVPLLTIPLTLDYLGAQNFGLWMTATSLTALAGFADLGLGNGLLTRLPRILVQAPDDARAVIASAYGALCGGGAFIAALSIVAAVKLDLAALLGGDASSDEGVVLVCLLCFAAGLPLSLVQRVQVAAQDTLLSNLWQAGGAGASLLLVLATIAANTSPTVVVLGGLGGPLVAALLNVIVYFGVQRPHLRPHPRSVSAAHTAQLMRLGVRFFTLGILTALALNIDNLLIAQISGVEAVSTFSVVMRVFSTLSLLVTLIALPLWSANADALARHDLHWVQTTARRVMLATTSAVLVAGGFLVLSRDFVFSAWLQDAFVVPLALALNLLMWSALLAVASPMFSVQNSVGALRYQMIGWSAFLATSVPAKIFAIEALGPAGAPLAGSLCYVATLIPTAIIGYRSVLRQERHLAMLMSPPYR